MKGNLTVSFAFLVVLVKDGTRFLMDILQRTDLNLGPLIPTFLIGFTTFVLLLWYSAQKQRYWKKIGIPYVTPYPFFGSVLENIHNIRKPIHEIEQDRYRKFGKIYGHYEGNRPLLTVAEPDLLRSLLVKDFPSFSSRRNFSTGNRITENVLVILQGEEWKRVRSIITPTFSTGKIKRMMNIFYECSQTLVKNFREASKAGKPIEAKTFYGAYTMDVIASSAFSTKIDSHNDPNNKFVATARHLFTGNNNWRIVLFILMPSVVKFFKISFYSPRAINFFDDVTMQIIEERKRTGQRRNDFLQLLLDTAQELTDEGKLDLNEKDDIAENYGKEENSEISKPTEFAKKTLSNDEIIAQCVVFFLAGYETTASTLSFASYLLALNTDVQEKLIEELDNALSENNGELTYEAIQSMKYLDNVISETLRLYPPTFRTERLADEDCKLGDTGITVPKGMIVTIPIYAMHRDPKYFPDPEKFDPDRFTPEERAKRNQFVYMPFGSGPRKCVAMRFALMEVKLCLANVLKNFRIKKCPQTKVPLEFYIGLQSFLQPKDVTLSLKIRKDIEKAL